MNEEQLMRYIRASVLEIIERVGMSPNLLEEKNRNKLMKQIDNILNQFNVTIEEVVPKLMLESYFGSVEQANKLMAQAGMDVSGEMVLNSAGQVTQAFQRPIHMQAVGNLVDDTLLDLRAAIRTARSNSQASIDGALDGVREEMVKGLIIGDANKVVQKRVMDSFEQNGLTAFITKDGRRLPLDYYSRLVTRTKMREATTEGSMNRYNEKNVGLVTIHERADCCSVCAAYQGMTVSLTGEHEDFPTAGDVAMPPYHPHCRATLRPFVIEYKTKEEIQSEADKWKGWSEEKDERTLKQKREYEKEQEARRKANAEKKQYARWKMVMGDDAPKTLGAFRRMKRQNTVRFQEMESEFMSIAIKEGRIS